MKRERKVIEKRKRIVRRAGVTVLVGVLLALSAASIAYWRCATPERIRAAAQAHLQQYFTTPVSIEQARFSWRDGVELRDVRIASVRPADEIAIEAARLASADEAFHCPRIRLRGSLAALLTGRLRVEYVEAIKPTLTVVRYAKTGATNLTGILAAIPEERARTLDWPTLNLQDVRIAVLSRDDAGLRRIEDMILEIRGRRSQASGAAYDLVWEESSPRRARGHARLDLRTGEARNVRGGLPWMSLEAVMIAVNAGYDEAGNWQDLLGLSGRVRARDFDLRGLFSGRGARSATIDLQNAKLSLPIDRTEESLPRNERYLRFDDVNGTIELTRDRVKARFKGAFHGSECEVQATMTGGVERLANLDDVHFEAEANCRNLELPREDPSVAPAEARFIGRWRGLSRFYEDFSPRGMVDASIRLSKRAGRDEQVHVPFARIVALSGDVAHQAFPYRVYDITGVVEYGPDGLLLRNLCGQRAGGTVCLNGSIARLAWWCPMDLHFVAQNVNVDEELLSRLPGVYTKINERFAPRGRVNMDLTLTRLPALSGERSRWRTEFVAHFNDLSATYAGLPYPLSHLHGTIRLEHDVVDVVHVEGLAGEAPIAVQGCVRVDRNGISDARIVVDARSLDADCKLIEALPERAGERVTFFGPQGIFDARGVVWVDPREGRLRQATRLTPRGMSLRHAAFPLLIEDVQGTVFISDEGLRTENLHGRYKDASLTAQIDARWSEEGTEAALDLRATALSIDKELKAALPQGAAGALGEWDVSGSLALRTTLKVDDALGQIRLEETQIDMEGASVRHPLFPQPLEDVLARLRVAEGTVHGEHLEARYAGGAMTGTFRTEFDRSRTSAVVRLTARELKLDESIRDLLPKKAREVWDSMGVSGRVDLALNRLHLCGEPGLAPTAQVDGRIVLRDVALDGVGRLEGLNGLWGVSGWIVDSQGGTSLEGTLDLSEWRMLSRQLGPSRAPWQFFRTAEGEGRLLIDNLSGTIYDGTCTGRVEVSMAKDASTYDASVMLYNVKAGPLLKGAANAPHGSGTDAIDVQGRVDASMFLRGPLGDPSQRQGGGRFSLTEGRMYRVPFLLAVLNVLNLSVPESHAFREAHGSFFMVGNRVELEELEFRGSALRLVGRGTMSLPDCSVDLRLVNLSTGGWSHVPVLADFFAGASRELAELHVTGPLSGPTVRAMPLRGVTEEIRRLFKRREPRPIRPAGP